MTTTQRLGTNQNTFKTVVLPKKDFGSLADQSLTDLGQQLQHVCHSLEAQNLVLDMSAITRVGASFLGILAQVQQSLLRHDKRLIVVGDRRCLLVITKLAHTILVFDNMDDAVDYCSKRLPAKTSC